MINTIEDKIDLKIKSLWNDLRKHSWHKRNGDIMSYWYSFEVEQFKIKCEVLRVLKQLRRKQ